MKTLIIDDERLARSELKRLLAPYSNDVTIVGEAANVVEARAKIEQLVPDLLLLDIEMPGETGFDLLESLEWLPQVIFTTAYAQHAVRAFEVNAIDYLLKPIDSARLAKALDRIERAKPSAARRIPEPRRFFVRDGERCWFVDSGEIPLIVSDGNYARLCVAGHEPMVPRTLSRLEEQLGPLNFFRANRAQLVNLGWVKAVEPGPDGRLVFILRDGRQVELSRRQSRQFRARTAI